MNEYVIYGLLCFAISFLTALAVSKKVTNKKKQVRSKNKNGVK